MPEITSTPTVTPDPNAPAPNKPAEKAPQRPQVVAQAKAPKVTYYQVLHGAVGVWAQGAVISSDELVANVHDIDRLLKLGAIAVTDAPIEDAPADE